MPDITVYWTRPAQKQLRQLFEHIANDSPVSAGRVVEEIVKGIDKASKNPEVYPADKYKVNNDGSYRAFEKHQYRISYRYSNEVLRVLRVRHTSMVPKPY